MVFSTIGYPMPNFNQGITSNTFEQQINNNVISKDAGKVLIDVILNKVTDGQMIGLTLFMCLVPVVSYVLSYFIIKKKYIIDEELYDTMIKEIALRKES